MVRPPGLSRHLSSFFGADGALHAPNSEVGSSRQTRDESASCSRNRGRIADPVDSVEWEAFPTPIDAW
jgi:hypothetical protein